MDSISLPPIITIILAFITKNVFILFLGLILGNLVICDMNIMAAINGV